MFVIIIRMTIDFIAMMVSRTPVMELHHRRATVSESMVPIALYLYLYNIIVIHNHTYTRFSPNKPRDVHVEDF